MAEGLFRHATKDRQDITVSSAGVSAMDGNAPSIDAVRVLEQIGIDIQHQRSQFLTQDDVANSDYIFAMTRGHLQSIQHAFPHAAEKTFLVREFEDTDNIKDIPDPIGMGIEVYTLCRDTIRNAIPSLIEFIDQSDKIHP